LAVFAVVPVKRLCFSKRRLSGVLNPQERRLLTLAMLEDVLTALKLSTAVQEIVVVSNDLNVQEVADKFGVSHFSVDQPGLNPAIEEATKWCIRNHADSVLVVPADIPLVSAQDIDEIVALGSEGKSVVLSPSTDGGTNALFKCPPNLVPARFGLGSSAKHAKEAYNKGVCVKLHYSIGIANDIDSSEDLKKIFEVENNTMSKRVLEQIGWTMSDKRYMKPLMK
jgi:2-phospho-L-lactate/phosphoenolpyruvate guanylyltransferase